MVDLEEYQHDIYCVAGLSAYYFNSQTNSVHTLIDFSAAESRKNTNKYLNEGARFAYQYKYYDFQFLIGLFTSIVLDSHRVVP